MYMSTGKTTTSDVLQWIHVSESTSTVARLRLYFYSTSDFSTKLETALPMLEIDP